MSMSIHIDENWRVNAQHEIAIPMSAGAVWGQMRDLRRFITRDPLHRNVKIVGREHLADGDGRGSLPFSVGTQLIIAHRLFGIGPDRMSRILRWQEGKGYAFSDLSKRGCRRGFPHICAYEIRPDGERASRLSIQARGRWTARFIPRWMIRSWLRWVLTMTGVLILLELRAVRRAHQRAACSIK